MAIATATALALGSIAVSAGSAGVSFTQAGKQRRLQQEAENDAAKALAEARKKLDVNYYENLGINKEPYELEREALVSAGAQAIQAGQESERGAAATAGSIQMAQQQGQRKIATDMGAEMLNLEKLTAAEDAKLAGERVKLDLGEVKGAQLAARDAQEAAAAYTTQGMQSAITAGTQAISTFVPLFAKTDVPTNTAGTGDILNPIQTPLASAPQGSQMQFAPQAQRAFMPQGNTTQQGSPLSQFQIPALGAMNRSKLDLMSREELLKLLTGGR
jgi:hypothetical protein